MNYLGEIRTNFRPLAAASLGSGSGLALTAYTSSVFAPHLLAQFGWSRGLFALVGLGMFVTVLALPIIGRITDRIGVRPVAFIGGLLLPLSFLAYSQMQGNFWVFLCISSSVLVIGSMCGTLVYSRLIAEHFKEARGLALTLMNCVPGCIAVVGIPILNRVIEIYGWRVAYVVFAIFVFVCGMIAIALIPNKKKILSHKVNSPNENANALQASARPTVLQPRMIPRGSVIWIIVAAFFLVMLQSPLHASQMNLMLIDQVKSTQIAANIVSVYAFGTIVGRVTCGLALDRYSTPIVAAVSMGLPAIGFFLLASSISSVPVIAFSMFLIGLSVGAENDLSPFLVARYFPIEIYSSTLSLIQGISFIGSATAAGATSLLLTMGYSYVPYLYALSIAIVFAGMLFLFLPKSGVQKAV